MQLICATTRLTDPGSYGFSLRSGDSVIDGFIVCRGGELKGWRNSCPHTGGPLDWVDHQFLDIDNEFIQCATHDARFRLDDGECVMGPCPGQRLEPLAIRVERGNIYLLEATDATADRS